MYFNQTGDIFTLKGSTLKLVDKFTYLGSSVSSTETDINMRLAKHGQLSIGLWSYGSQTYLIKWSAVSSKQWLCWYCYMDAPHRRLLNGCRKSLTGITQECCEQYWTSPRDSTPQSSSYTATFHPSWRLSKLDEPDHTGHCWRSRDELISDVLSWTPSHGCAKAGCPAKTYIQQLCANTGCSPEDLPKAMDDREVWRERVRNICTDSPSWWWWWCLTIYLHAYLKLIILKCIFKNNFQIHLTHRWDPNRQYHFGSGLVGFYGISTIEDYLMPNPIYTY